MEQRGKPVILIVDPAGAEGATAPEMNKRYLRSYTIAATSSAQQATDELRHLAADRHDVALILADRATAGTVVLDTARQLHPHGRRGLLLDWNERRTHREEVAAAFAQRQAECFVTKPAGDPDERFHRDIIELLDEWRRAHGLPAVGVRIIGCERSPRISEICDVLQRHNFPYTFHLVGSVSARTLLTDVRDEREPVIILHDVACWSIPRTSSSPTLLALGLSPARGSTTSSWSAADRQGYLPPSTPNRKACALP